MPALRDLLPVSMKEDCWTSENIFIYNYGLGSVTLVGRIEFTYPLTWQEVVPSCAKSWIRHWTIRNILSNPEECEP